MADLPFSLKEDDVVIDGVSKVPAIYNQQHEEYKNFAIKELEWRNIASKIGRSIPACKKRWRTIRDNYYKQQKASKLTGRPCGRRYSLTEKLAFLEYRKDGLAKANSIKDETDEGSDNFEVMDESSSNFLEVVEEDECLEQNENSIYKVTDPAGNSAFKIIEPTVNSMSSFKLLNSEQPFDPLTSVSATKSDNSLCHAMELLENKDSKLDAVIKLISGLNDIKEQDDVDLFFKSMAMTVKKFSPENIALVKLKVCQIVMDVEMQKKN